MAVTREQLTHEQCSRLAEFIAPFRVKPGRKVVLADDFDPAFKAGIKKKKDGKELLGLGAPRRGEEPGPPAATGNGEATRRLAPPLPEARC